MTASEALNLRAGPGMSYQVIEWLSPGDLLTITQRGAWLAVQTESGAAGWVKAAFCKIGD